MAGNNGHLGLLADEEWWACTEFVKLKVREDINTLAQLAQEGLRMSPDALNNVIYGRVAIDDTFNLKLGKFLEEYSPKIFEQMLNRYYHITSIRVGENEKPEPWDDREFPKAIQMLLRKLTDLSDKNLEHFADNRIDPKEADVEIELVKDFRKLLDKYEHTLMQKKTDHFAEIHQLALEV